MMAIKSAKILEFKSEHIVPGKKRVENPYWSRGQDGTSGKPRYIDAQINIKESAITTLAAKKQLNEAQVMAAEKFRVLWERMGGKGASAIDWRKEAVDGGTIPDPIGVAQMDAGKQLKTAHTVLTDMYGHYAYKLVGYIVGDGYSIHELTETRRQRDTMTDNLRMYLDCLAVLWNLQTKRS